MGFLAAIFSLISLLLISCTPLGASASDLETYIVRVEFPDTQLSAASLKEDLKSWYHSFLPISAADSNKGSSLVYSYHNVFKGFAAKLSPEQVKAMEKMPGFVSARPQQILPLHTTHSPNFLGLNQNMGFWSESIYGKGIIIGVLDTGINPDHPSFGDEGVPPPPSKWKGICEFGATGCNNKLIGARAFQETNASPMDEDGHGTHTASTAAGNFVKGANALGNANGTAAGVAPLAHLASYKVCTTIGCSESAILAAMDIAIDDGVDILSLSFGGSSMPFYSDPIASGAYSAMERGIFVSCAAGNRGPFIASLSNEAPWILTVGASTIDRKIRATAKLGNNLEFDGQSLYQPKDFPPTQFPLFYPGMNINDSNSRYCSSQLINNIEARGKIVVCNNGGGVTRIGKGQNVKSAGGVGMIIINQGLHGYTTLAEAHVLPAVHLSYVDGLNVIAYINSTTSPTASISFKGTIIEDNHAPAVASFSSRGPSRASPGILKPDIIGPGVNILAAWHLSVENNTSSKSNFNVLAGTSMSCPHLSGVAALLKSTHPGWSPATIKSAIMTTADVLNLANKGIEDEILLQPANVFATGSGHVNPAKANNPGLIYDIKPEDYVPYLCGLGYTIQQISSILQRRVTCNSRIAEAQLNYPSFSIQLRSAAQSYTRTVTNVGVANSSYVVEVVPPQGVRVTVKPNVLTFSQLNQELQYEVKFISTATNITSSQGYLSWNSANYSVRSPIVAIMGK